MKKQDIEDIFSSMENFSSVPPPELWSQIEKKLDQPKKKKKAILWWSVAACLLLGLLLPSVLHFTSNSAIKTIKNGTVDNNPVVLDAPKNDFKAKQNLSTQEAKTEGIILEKQSDNPAGASAIENKSNQKNNYQKNQNQKTTVAHTDYKNVDNSTVLNPKSNTRKAAVKEEAVAEKTQVTNQKNGFNSDSQYQIANTDKKASDKTETEKIAVSAQANLLNTDPKNQIAKADKKASDKTETEKVTISAQANLLNTDPKNQIAKADKKASDKTKTEKVTVSAKANSFNSGSKNQIAKADKKASDKTESEKVTVSAQANLFNSGSKNQIAKADKKASDKILAEKTFVAGKANPFHSTSKNKLANSIFENQAASNSNNTLAFNLSDSSLNSKQKVINDAKAKQNNTGSLAEKQTVSNANSNLKFDAVLSKQDSVQLAQLQNLEKGIITPEEKTEKESKALPKGEKWALEVFAGIANSENYKNEKTFGNTNDSKQSNSYGVKTKYKINKKWTVASGFKINELGQSVANVSYLSAKNNAFFSSSDYFNQNATAAAPRIAESSDYVFVTSSTVNALKENDIESSNIQRGNLDQNLRYIEMPLEVSYSIFSRNKASIYLNTGGFVGKLISNNVALDGSSMGENINANDFIYGSTLSSTLQYRIYKKTNVFVEPAMNYYINPLTNQSFNQFQWGLNFGLNVSF
ncbi:hypothetical protein BC749_10862 [Flavobacterium araucananum]|uniref:Outer membrane protein beta-barrel domain-containing protein n=1 Tax=Flavobacterium araucananum TaxID=946678 RepID=A0A227P4N1_9FLAO|nr:hypothetical protein [Flavobacterium araucananum]OXG04483.1 hypothetical protein B0A64_14930 [Flavobacterium araucananum]PWJ96919.1 hypothetical protein BC749_10862 [Flavobacterium araucananum]